MADPERRPLNLVQNGDETQVSEAIPASILWLQAVDPTVITPYTWENGGMVHIIFRNPTGTVVVNVYRTISHFPNDTVTIQDEVHPSFENEGAKYNYTIDPDGNIVEHSSDQAFSEQIQPCINLLLPLVSQKGSSIMAIKGGAGIESRFESDGTQWINERQKIKLSPPSLPATK